jgi:hypothetical protein
LAKLGRLLVIVAVLVLVANGLAFVSAAIFGELWLLITVLTVSLLGVYFCYVQFVQKKKPRYPLVPPEGKQDMYLPRTDIPRPVFEDFRKMKEKKQKLAKLRRTVQKKTIRKKH